ncbi:hypothetical protein [Clostridium magnum]|uniref:Uncharacterized protein n=1 Tax=Clostridium magnum DSM 2767 TaxID=1121326 RepID=A0A162UE13_9CLOT|nr:hypothetical protein [Clostridium magnum]KZL93800.1 hypothetical protein CLMAG_08510 [Clostridium magnum DSM 2767]SHI08686.1 hypothetical protein SAMN02745944_02397 [Clostridium magnum DSM 2767]
MFMKIKDLKRLIEGFNDEDEVAVEVGEELYECYAYDNAYCRNELRVPTLVIGKE